ncbi:MAG TPA: group III truncated hemoglobin [Methylovirgula sp.]
MTYNPLTDRNVAHAEIDDQSIRLLISTFYSQAREDELIGPIFAAAVVDWDEHIENIANFWSSVMLRTTRYKGRPLRPHLILPLKGEHFDRWLQLFESTARELFAEDVAEAFVVRARRIADSFELAIGTQRGEIRQPRHSVKSSI